MITKTIEKAVGELEQTEFGEFTYGMIRLFRPMHTLMAFENPERGALAAYVGLALKHNGKGGATVLGGNLKNMQAKLGLGMQIIKAADDYVVPLQHDLDLLITDSLELFDRFSDRVKTEGHALIPTDPARAFPLKEVMILPDNMQVWVKHA